MGLRERINTDLREIWHHGSAKILAALIAFPEAYNGLSGLGWWATMPQVVCHVMSGLATAGFLAKFYKQNPLPEKSL